ncbi:unnamed protein product [Albugo candida]|uniref:Uncharacterized protein n=1 Tax=Albugo candida TaxID=65357 RepID=A0A024FUP4_9STRA|nr:unnamed protein product [Albugo candida]|eukprot:CCI10369.1 unnamed protein product [Albugo candida]
MKEHNDLNAPLNLLGYSEAEFYADKNERKLVTWKYIEVADFTAASIVVAEMIVIKELLGEMSLDCVIPMLLKVDMKQLSSNLTESLHQKQNTLT